MEKFWVLREESGGFHFWEYKKSFLLKKYENFFQSMFSINFFRVGSESGKCAR